jgi:hypothetical protein
VRFPFAGWGAPRHLSVELRHLLQTADLPPGTKIADLGVAESAGAYAGRPVRYFRIFDPRRVARRSVDTNSSETYADLSHHLDLVLAAGFVESGGSPLLFAPTPRPDPATLQA